MGKTVEINDSPKLLNQTTAFFLRGMIGNLQEEVDIRGRGYQRFFLFQWALYLFALLRDIARIPLHNPRGIGQARFRGRILYIQQYANPRCCCC